MIHETTYHVGVAGMDTKAGPSTFLLRFIAPAQPTRIPSRWTLKPYHAETFSRQGAIAEAKRIGGIAIRATWGDHAPRFAKVRMS